MSRLPKVFIFLLLMLSSWLLVVPDVYAQEKEASVWEKFIEDLLGGISKNNVDETLEKINKSSLPFGVVVTPATKPQASQTSPEQTPTSSNSNVQGVSTVNTDPLYKTAGEYTVAASSKLPKTSETASSNLADFFKNFLGNVQDFLGFGSKKATEFAGSRLPPGTTASNQQEAMLRSLPLAQCGSLPFGACANNLLQSEETPPFVTPPGEIIPTGSVVPPSVDGPCDEKGGDYCRQSCLSKFWSKPEDVKIASYICLRESGGNPFALNDNCLNSTDKIDNDEKKEGDGSDTCVDLGDNEAEGCKKPYYDGATVDFSVGLFQINLLAHCSAAQPTYAWQPPTCKFGNIAARDTCENNLLNYVENIKTAVRMSGNGKNWCPWATARDKFCKRK